MKRLGVELLVISNASGGVHPRLVPGDLVVIRDHIHLLGHRLLAAEAGEDAAIRPRRRNSPYDEAFARQALAIARAVVLWHTKASMPP